MILFQMPSVSARLSLFKQLRRLWFFSGLFTFYLIRSMFIDCYADAGVSDFFIALHTSS